MVLEFDLGTLFETLCSMEFPLESKPQALASYFHLVQMTGLAVASYLRQGEEARALLLVLKMTDCLGPPSRYQLSSEPSETNPDCTGREEEVMKELHEDIARLEEEIRNASN
jgi:hypothetical protein